MGVEGRTATAPQDDGILYIGLDLGTSQSSIVTSTDVRRTVTSVVGWPKDLISYKFLQKQVVIGDECLENRMAVDMIWPLEHGVFSTGQPTKRRRRHQSLIARRKRYSTWFPTSSIWLRPIRARKSVPSSARQHALLRKTARP